MADSASQDCGRIALDDDDFQSEASDLHLTHDFAIDHREPFFAHAHVLDLRRFKRILFTCLIIARIHKDVAGVRQSDDTAGRETRNTRREGLDALHVRALFVATLAGFMSHAFQRSQAALCWSSPVAFGCESCRGPER